MFNPPELIALVMSATRMYRSLANFGDAHRCALSLSQHLLTLIMTPRSTNVPSSGQPSTGPRVPVQVPIEVSVHRAYVTDRSPEDDVELRYGGTTHHSVEDKYAIPE